MCDQHLLKCLTLYLVHLKKTRLIPLSFCHTHKKKSTNINWGNKSGAVEHNDRTIITRQGFISLTAKQSLARLFSPKNAILACESSKQLALSFTSASASWRFDRELNMFFFLSFFSSFVVLPPAWEWLFGQGARRCGNVEPRLHFADTQACAFMPRPIKMAESGCYLLGLAAAVQGDWSFSWNIFTAKGVQNSSLCAIFHNKGGLNFTGWLKL